MSTIKNPPITIAGQDVTDWTDAQRADLQAAIDSLGSVTREVEETVDAEVKARTSPAEIIKKVLLDRDRMVKVRDELNRATVDRFALESLIAQHGRDRLSKLDTKGGMVVVRCPTEDEAFAQAERVADLPSLRERTRAGYDYLVSLCVHPARPDDVRAIGARWPGFWSDVDQAVSLLSSARADAVAPLD